MLYAQAAGSMTMPSNMGLPTTPSGPLAGSGIPAANGGDGVPSLNINDTFVSWIDSAVPRTNFGLRFDATYNDRQPMRATYLFAKGGLPNSPGFTLPETRVDTLEFTSYAEYSVMPWLSVFIEAPYRWVNPEINGNQSGPGEMRYGLKLCTWSDDDVIASVLLRIYQPTARDASLGTSHWSIEPGLLVAYRISEKIHFEGEFRYWIPLGGGDFAGDMLRYGAGLSYGQRNPAGLWYTPVTEVIGWTILSGKSMVTASVDDFVVQDARNETIVNAYLGVRVGYGANMDVYLGYGRALTGQYWARDNYRFEFKISY